MKEIQGIGESSYSNCQKFSGIVGRQDDGLSGLNNINPICPLIKHISFNPYQVPIVRVHLFLNGSLDHGRSVVAGVKKSGFFLVSIKYCDFDGLKYINVTGSNQSLTGI